LPNTGFDDLDLNSFAGIATFIYNFYSAHFSRRRSF
jgi:hypothetical protein